MFQSRICVISPGSALESRPAEPVCLDISYIYDDFHDYKDHM